jgi:hypothetical protein
MCPYILMFSEHVTGVLPASLSSPRHEPLQLTLHRHEVII